MSGTSYESVTFQGTMFNKSYQLYGLINTKSFYNLNSALEQLYKKIDP